MEWRCAYCGKSIGQKDHDHVVPKCLYPTEARSKVQLLTVPACNTCNNSWSDDEAHFRNVLLIAGDPNPSVEKLWFTKVKRSFEKKDGQKRRKDLVEQMVLRQTSKGQRFVVYPASDPRFMRVIHKIIRGLCHHHNIMTAVAESRVWADVWRFEVPSAFLKDMKNYDRNPEIFEYYYHVIQDPPIHSYWLLSFYQNKPFIGAVSTTDEGFPNSMIQKVGP